MRQVPGGVAAICGDKWLQLAWIGDWPEQSITVKELGPIVLAIAVWGKAWARQRILAKCDNMAVVHVLRARTSKHPLVMHLLRSLYFFVAEWEIVLWAEHIPGELNTLADAISRNLMQVFRQAAPLAQEAPTLIPAPILQLLVTERPDWTSPTWRGKLSSIFSRV